MEAIWFYCIGTNKTRQILSSIPEKFGDVYFIRRSGANGSNTLTLSVRIIQDDNAIIENLLLIIMPDFTLKIWGDNIIYSSIKEIEKLNSIKNLEDVKPEALNNYKMGNIKHQKKYTCLSLYENLEQNILASKIIEAYELDVPKCLDYLILIKGYDMKSIDDLLTFRKHGVRGIFEELYSKLCP